MLFLKLLVARFLKYLAKPVFAERDAAWRQNAFRTGAMLHVNMALARGGAAAASRVLDPRDPLSWEFSGFSQNGEDGILDYLTRRLTRPNRYFIEIGASNGLENNTTWLALVRRWSGLMIEGDPVKSAQCADLMQTRNWGLTILNRLVTRGNIVEILSGALHKQPDVLSLDIDGVDYYIARDILAAGFRPKVFVVEYQSAYGPGQSLTVEYADDFDIDKASPDRLYYGVSIAGWRRFFEVTGYRFVTVDSNGVNAFFADPAEFPAGFFDTIHGAEFRENFAQFNSFRTTWEGQFERIKSMKFSEIV